MKPRNVVLMLSLLALSTPQLEAFNANRLWYTKPADDSARKLSADKARWGSKFSKEALPLGNGRLGCMSCGGEEEDVHHAEPSLAPASEPSIPLKPRVMGTWPFFNIQ